MEVLAGTLSVGVWISNETVSESALLVDSEGIVYAVIRGIRFPHSAVCTTVCMVRIV